ncbi:MAG: hypothetical protein ABH952_09770 [Candidatus Omnitrophota bacterium]
MSIKGKRLLHVGGALFQVPAIKCAKKNGCYVILADRDKNVPGRQYADIYEPVSTTDKENLLVLAKKYKIDGVMTYASDSSTPAVAYVAQEMNLPGNPLQATRILQRKDLFRQFQKDSSLIHPEFGVVTNQKEAIRTSAKLGFPIVVKPVDAAGTRGQSVVCIANEVEAAFDQAIKSSRLGKVIMEKFLRANMMELDGDVLVKNNELAFRHYGHNYFMKNRISNVPCGEIFPGFYDNEITGQLDEQFRVIIKGLGLRIGCMNFDGVVSGGKVNILDIGLRNGGNFVPEMITLSTGFDLTKAAVFAVLGCNYPVDWLACPNPKPAASYLIASRLGGTLENIEFSDELKPFIKEYRPFFNTGDMVFPYTSSNRAIGCLFLQFSDMDTLQSIIDQIEDLVRLRIKPSFKFSHKGSEKTQIDPNAYKTFSELISPFLKTKLNEAKRQGNETVIRALAGQYVEPDNELEIRTGEGLKHYDASADVYFEGKKIVGIERLYRRVIIFEPLDQCLSHCRYCLRRNYDHFTQKDEDIKRAARFIGLGKGHQELREILVTGGDPFLVPDKLEMFLDGIAEHAPQIELIRVATRVPAQQPDRVNEKILNVLAKKYPFTIEVPTQINHAAELFPEVVDAYRRILNVVRIVYNQTVLLKGINNTKDELIDLFDKLRQIGIENHYLFPCVPIGGLNHFRVPLMKAIELARQISSSGRISGRAKPKLCLMTSIGKITPYEGTILDYKNNRYLLKSDYLYEERIAWNPNWKMAPNTEVSDDGYLCVWYEDAAPVAKAAVCLQEG